MAMPILMINMGVEMLYILNQRLGAQKIKEKKGTKVLGDVAKALFNEKFVKEMFKLKPIYCEIQLRSVFHKLAHASIMRLNKNSMHKLYDLMAMGFKYQVINAKRPSHIIDITCNHLSCLRTLLTADPEAVELLDLINSKVISTYGGLTTGELSRLRRTLLQNLQDWKIKVSMFLREKMQDRRDGSCIVRHKGLCPGFVVPGNVKYADGKTATLKVKNAEGVVAKGVCEVKLGTNLWYKDKPAEKVYKKEKILETEDNQINVQSAQAAKAELNALADLLGSTKVSGKDNFQLDNLFAANEIEDDGKTVNRESDIAGELIEFGGAEEQQKWSNKIKAKFDVEVEEEPEEDEDDLLALMDG